MPVVDFEPASKKQPTLAWLLDCPRKVEITLEDEGAEADDL
jgi:hypothetical protein